MPDDVDVLKAVVAAREQLAGALRRARNVVTYLFWRQQGERPLSVHAGPEGYEAFVALETGEGNLGAPGQPFWRHFTTIVGLWRGAGMPDAPVFDFSELCDGADVPPALPVQPIEERLRAVFAWRKDLRAVALHLEGLRQFAQQMGTKAYAEFGLGRRAPGDAPKPEAAQEGRGRRRVLSEKPRLAMTPKELGERLHVSESGVRKMVERGTLPAFKDGDGRLYFDAADVLELLRAREPRGTVLKRSDLSDEEAGQLKADWGE